MAKAVRDDGDERPSGMKKHDSEFAGDFLLAQFLSLNRMAVIAGVAPPDLVRCASGHVMVDPDCPDCRADLERELDKAR